MSAVLQQLSPLQKCKSDHMYVSVEYVILHDANIQFLYNKQESRAVAGKPRDAAVIFQDDSRLPSWIWVCKWKNISKSVNIWSRYGQKFAAYFLHHPL